MKKKFLIFLVFVLIMNLMVPALAAGSNTGGTGDIKVYANDTRILFDVQPILVRNRTMVPVRAAFEFMGALVEWDNDTKTATLIRGKIIKIQVDNPVALVDGVPVRMDVPATLINGRILVPLRFIGEALGAEVSWVPETKTAFIQDVKVQNELGNILNWGRFATDNIWNYYILQDGVLVRENIENRKQEKIADHMVCDLHIIQDWLYCIGIENGVRKVIRLSKDGTEKEILLESVDSMQIVNDWIYYGQSQDQTTLYRTKTDGSETKKIVSDGKFSPKSWFIQNGWIFYANRNTHKLTRIRIDGSESKALADLSLSSIAMADQLGSDSGSAFLPKMIDGEYIYLVLEKKGYSGNTVYLPGVYRLPVQGGNLQQIIDKVPLSMNMDSDWMYVVVKNGSRSQLVKYRKDGAGVLTLNEYKENDVPGHIYINLSSVYYTLTRGTGNQEELMFKMSSNGMNVKSLTWIYGADYYSVKDLLTEVTKAHSKLFSYITSKSATLKEKENTVTVFQESRVNRSQTLYHEKTRESNSKVELELWKDKEHLYSKASNEKKWSIQKLSELGIPSGQTTVFDFIIPNEELCNNLSLEETNGEYILRGTGAFSVFMGNLLLHESSVYAVSSSFIDSVAMKITIDPQSYFIRELTLEISYSTQNAETGKIQQATVQSEYVNDRFNEIYLTLPVSLRQSVTDKKLAEFSIEEGLKRLQEKKYQEALEFFDSAIHTYDKAYKAYLYKGNTHYAQKNYREAVLAYDQYYVMNPSDMDVLAFQGMCYLKLGDLNRAAVLSDKVLGYNENSAVGLNLAGSLAAARGDHSEAIRFFQQAIASDNTQYEFQLNLISALYNMGNYIKCIQAADDSLKRFPNDRDLMFLKAQSFSSQGKSMDAIRVYEQILRQNPTNDFVTMTYIAIQYENIQNYTAAQEYANRAEAVYADYNILKYLIEKLEYDTSTTAAQKLVDFVQEYYLYYQDSQTVEKALDEMLSKGDSYTLTDVERLLDAIKNTKDTSSRILSGSAFDSFIYYYDNSSYDTWVEGDVIYFGIKTFSRQTGVKFVEFIQNVEKPEEKILLLDLRDNSVGLSEEANKILDVLLPECNAGYLVERDGYITTFSSGKSHTPFKKIGILVNGKTAGSSELLALSLKTFSPEVTIIGKKTMGKGTGEIAYLDRSKKIVLLLVNHYWNVLQKSIQDKGLEIDVPVGDDDPDYSKAIRKFVEAE